MSRDFTVFINDEKNKYVKQKLQEISNFYNEHYDVQRTEHAMTVFNLRYRRKKNNYKKNEDDIVEYLETFCETLWRVVIAVMLNYRYDEILEKIEMLKDYYELFIFRLFSPNSPTFTGAGTPIEQLSACFVLHISDDLGKSPDGIYSMLRNGALIWQSGGGTGFPFGQLREKGALVESSKGNSSGPVSFLYLFNAGAKTVGQGGVRSPANMGTMQIDHPDIFEFIGMKRVEGEVSNFNISVLITDKFIDCVKRDLPFDLISPHSKKIVRTVRARDLFGWAVVNSKLNGEPGYLFVDTANRVNLLAWYYYMICTNPCAEQWMGPFSSCNLGSINLVLFLLSMRSIDWEKLAKVTKFSTIFLNEVIDSNSYVPAVPQIKDMALKERRIGLGIMGLADVLIKSGLRYGSFESKVLASKLMEFIYRIAMETSIAMAKEKGKSFPYFKNSAYDFSEESQAPYKWDYPRIRIVNEETSEVYENTESIPKWILVKEDLKKNQLIWNSYLTTVAPTGTICTAAGGIEGYGLEPIFSLAYERLVNVGFDNKKKLLYFSKLFGDALIEADVSKEDQEIIKRYVFKHGSCQQCELVPEHIRRVFVTAHDLTMSEHIEMQAVLQKSGVDNSMSKTNNMSEDTTELDVENAILQAHASGLKGFTIYVNKSRKTEVLSIVDKTEEVSPSLCTSTNTLTELTHDDKICSNCDQPAVLNVSGCLTCSHCGNSACPL